MKEREIPKFPEYIRLGAPKEVSIRNGRAFGTFEVSETLGTYITQVSNLPLTTAFYYPKNTVEKEEFEFPDFFVEEESWFPHRVKGSSFVADEIKDSSKKKKESCRTAPIEFTSGPPRDLISISLAYYDLNKRDKLYVLEALLTFLRGETALLKGDV